MFIIYFVLRVLHTHLMFVSCTITLIIIN